MITLIIDSVRRPCVNLRRLFAKPPASNLRTDLKVSVSNAKGFSRLYFTPCIYNPEFHLFREGGMEYEMDQAALIRGAASFMNRCAEYTYTESFWIR